MCAASWSAAGSRWQSCSTCPCATPGSASCSAPSSVRLAYAGVDLAARPARRPRAASASTCRSGGSMPWAPCSAASPAGAVAWYLDAAQVAVIAAKLAAYATVHAPAPDYIVYPLFSKWGALSLGPGRGRRASALQRIALRRDQLVAGGTPVQHQPRLPDRTPAAQHRPDPQPVQRPGRDRPGRAGDPRAALGPVDGAGHLLVPAHGARPDLVRPGRCGAHRRRHPQELDPVAGGLPRLEPAGVPGPARLRLVPGADLVRPYGPARRDPGQPLLRRRRPRRREGRALDRPFRPGALRARRPAPLRDLGAAADPVLHPARRRVGPGLGRGRADAGVGPQPAAAGRRTS